MSVCWGNISGSGYTVDIPGLDECCLQGIAERVNVIPIVMLTSMWANHFYLQLRTKLYYKRRSST
jgi:hypothetical protein